MTLYMPNFSLYYKGTMMVTKSLIQNETKINIYGKMDGSKAK